MKVGVPKEVKNHEYRVAITPIGVHELTAHGHEVYVEKERRASARRSTTRSTSRPAPRSSTAADEVWGNADMVLKVKEPVAEEYHRMREGLTPLHLPPPGRRQAADRGADRAQGHRASPTRPCSCPPAGCRCSTRCPRSPAAWRRRSAPTR